MFQEKFLLQEEASDSESGSQDESGSGSDYEYEETYSLSQWFPPDFWRSKLDDAMKMSITKEKTQKKEGQMSVRGHDECDEDEYYYNLLKSKIRAAENVVVTDVTVNNTTVTFKVRFIQI